VIELATWLAELAAGEGTDVPCGECDACCRSGMFVHVEPDEVEALRRIPKALRFAAPGMPKGHVVLPYDTDGRCPMLTDAGCSIYEHRPRTCRRFDCRVYAAAGLEPDQPAIAAAVRRWRFDPADEPVLVTIRSRAAAHPGRSADAALEAVLASTGGQPAATP
jgi:uncharacterized protein